jgi:small subunit ribosomal protein S2
MIYSPSSRRKREKLCPVWAKPSLTHPDLPGRAAKQRKDPPEPGQTNGKQCRAGKKGAEAKRKKENFAMAVISMKALLESGVHFGHRTHKWHPGMKPYIFTERNGIHIIDLQKTSKALDQAYGVVRERIAENGTMLFVGTKRQAQETIQLEATRCGMPYVTERWLGGMLTNWRTIRARINELDRLERMRDASNFGHVTKKEALIYTRKIERLEMLLSGIRNMNRLPDLLFVVDISREATAIHEANLLNIPVIAMVDTNCDPKTIDYVIPSNDDAIRAIKLIIGKMADAVVEGKALRKEEEIEEEAELAVARGLLEEPELSDEDLLGEATLAKLSAQARGIVELEEEELGLEAELIEDEEEISEEETEEEEAEDTDSLKENTVEDAGETAMDTDEIVVNADETAMNADETVSEADETAVDADEKS